MSGAHIFPWRTALRAGVVAGIADIVAALAFWALRGISPVQILQGIAGGVLGADAYAGGAATALLGLALHFAIMLVIGAIYVLAAVRWPRMAERWAVVGTLFGIVVYVVMNAVVLPLSAFPHEVVFTPARVIPALLIQVVFVGLPIAWIAARTMRG